MHLLIISLPITIYTRFNIHSAVNLGQIAIWYHLRRLITITNFETCGAPIDKLYASFRLQGGNSSMDILWNNVTTIEQARCHVFAVTRVTLDHLVVGLEAGHGDFLDRVSFMGSLGGGDHWCVCDKREMDAWVWHQICLEFGKVNVEGAIKTKRRGDR